MSTIKPYVKFEKGLLNVIQKNQLSAYAISVLTILGLHTYRYSDLAAASLTQLMGFTGLSKNTVIKALNELVNKNIIIKTKRSGRIAALYQLTGIFNGVKEEQTPPEVISDVIDRGSSYEPKETSRGSFGEPLIYITKKQTKKKRKTSSFQKKDDVFFGNKNQSMDKNKLSLCKRYMSNLKELNLIKIRTTEAQYLASIYRKNDDVDTWQNLEEKTTQLAEQIETKKNTPKKQFVELEMGESLDKNTEEPKENPELERLKTSVNYKRDFEKIFVQLRSQNPMLKPGFFADKLVHAEMLAGGARLA